jgi:hypothetical protein
MSIFSKLYWKIKREQVKNFYRKLRKEVLKLCFAVVIAEGVMVGVCYVALNHGILEYFQPKTVNIINNAEAKTLVDDTQKPKNEGTVQLNVAEIADTIWKNESTRGKHNYSKCEEIGKVNGIGYGIAGDGKYMCFESHEEEMKVLEGWITEKRARGKSDKELMCLYSGNHYEICK